MPLKGSGGLYFYLQAAQGYRMTSHPLGRAARADAGAKFEGLRKGGDGSTAKFGEGKLYKEAQRPWVDSFVWYYVLDKGDAQRL
ncbi:hypothetical protein DWX03_07375 [Coprococcus comes]|uniref:Uncharacterized protein n=1 Tax=Coprococcus comes TaxID=410072 RepID=A0A412QH07_9FIRM|nr:hypothetical protein DWX03_07375 [Coprococcus comes]